MAETFLQRQQRIRNRGQQLGAQQPQAQPAATTPAPQPRPAAPAPAQPAPATRPAAAAPQPAQQTAAAATYQAAPQPAAAPMQLDRAYQQQQQVDRTQPVGAAQPTATPAKTYGVGDFNTWATQRYGRAATPQEMARIGAKVGAPQGPNGTYTQAQFEAAQAESDAIARGYGWNGPAIGAAAQPAFGPNSNVDPNVAGNVGHVGRVQVTPGQAYTPGQIGAFQGPQTGNVNPLNISLMEQILGNPESLSPDVIAQMKAGGKADAAKQAEQLRQQAATTLAGRGFSGAGGMQAAADAAVDSNFLETLLNSNRDVDIRAATQNFQDRLAASQAGTNFQNAASQRAIGESGAEVQRFGANEGARQAGSADALARGQFQYGQMQADRGANLQEWLARQGVNLDTQKFQEAQKQFKQTFGLDMAQFLESVRQYNQNFGEGSRQFNVGAGLNTAALQQRANDSLLAWLQAGGL